MNIARLAELIERRRPCVALTGAGISTPTRYKCTTLAQAVRSLAQVSV